MLVLRQRDDELGEGPHLGARREGAAVALGHDVLGKPQAQPGAFAGRFGSEERVKNLIHHLRRNARAIVAHVQLHRPADAPGAHRTEGTYTGPNRAAFSCTA